MQLTVLFTSAVSAADWTAGKLSVQLHSLWIDGVPAMSVRKNKRGLRLMQLDTRISNSFKGYIIFCNVLQLALVGAPNKSLNADVLPIKSVDV